MQMAEEIATWTLEEVHRLPEDGNRYELVRGELFVTPAPSPAHESLAVVLRMILEPYVRAQHLGIVWGPRAVVRINGSEVEPDLMVRPTTHPRPIPWEAAAVPILVVEILSRTTQRRDHAQKREFYLENGVAEYWIVDGNSRSIHVVQPGRRDTVTDATLVWQPERATEPLVIDLVAYFREALG